MGGNRLLQDFFPEWEDFFPDKDRRAMYVWAPNADVDDIEDMVWLMQELKNMEREQHGVPERCESGPRLRLPHNILRLTWCCVQVSLLLLQGHRATGSSSSIEWRWPKYVLRA